MRLKCFYCKVLEREFRFCADRSPNQIDLAAIEQGLHITPDKLRAEIQSRLDTVEESYEAVLLGYGLCGNGVAGLSCRIPLVIPRAHDCISLLLGSRKRHEEFSQNHPGCYFFSLGWLTEAKTPGPNYDGQLREEYTRKYGPDNAEYLLKTENRWRAEYHRAVYIDWHLTDTEKFQQITRQCADYLGWDYERIDGDPSLLQRMIDGDWNPQDFLIVQSGRKIPDHFVIHNESPSCGRP